MERKALAFCCSSFSKDLMLGCEKRKSKQQDKTKIEFEDPLQEFIVDHVSCDGIHKTTMVWMYDFQEANGKKLCVGQVPIPHTPIAEALIAYTRNCLDALSIRNGATHSEIILTSDGPCLVEAS